MSKTIKTRRLEFEKSTFIIDLVKHENKQLYVTIKQTILEEKKSSLHHEIKINPEVLRDLLIVLNSYNNYINTEITYVSDDAKKKSVFTERQIATIINRYLKGVSIKDLTIQFDCHTNDIMKVLLANKIAIVSNRLPE